MSEYSADFELFWSHYPRRVGKRAAWLIWKRLQKGLPKIEDILKIVDAQKAQWKDPQYIPHPRTWLFQGRWEDEIDGVKDKNSAQKVAWSGPKCNRCGRPGVAICGSVKFGKVCETCYRQEEEQELGKLERIANANQPEPVEFIGAEEGFEE